MKHFLMVVAILFACTCAFAQKFDVSFVAGGSFSSDTKVAPTVHCVTVPCPAFEIVKTNHRYFLEGTGAVRLASFRIASLHLELPFAATPSALLGGGNITLTSLYVTPSLRLKFASGSPISPFVSVGGGFAHYNVNNFDTTSTRGALQFGGGVDIKTGIPLLAFRAEVRDFVTGQPDLGFLAVPFLPNQPRPENGLRHNVLAGGGIVLRF